MYDGEPCQVTLRCADNLMKQVIDRFGEDVLTRDLGEGAFEAEVFLSASPTFYAWVFTFGGDIQIIAPETIREQYQQMLQLLLERIDEQPEITVTWFSPDKKKAGGQYHTATGKLKRIDTQESRLILTDGTQIPLEDLLRIRIESFQDDP